MYVLTVRYWNIEAKKMCPPKNIPNISGYFFEIFEGFFFFHFQADFFFLEKINQKISDIFFLKIFCINGKKGKKISKNIGIFYIPIRIDITLFSLNLLCRLRAFLSYYEYSMDFYARQSANGFNSEKMLPKRTNT